MWGRQNKHTIWSLGLRLVEHNVVDIKVGHVAHIERHDMVIARANIVVGDVTSAIGLSVACRQELLDHLENVSKLARVQRGT